MREREHLLRNATKLYFCFPTPPIKLKPKLHVGEKLGTDKHPMSQTDEMHYAPSSH